jgi:hypothetical protein
MNVVVNTSVWFEFFKGGCTELSILLNKDKVLIHPFIIGQLTCGTPPKRQQTLNDLSLLSNCVEAHQVDVLQFIEINKLFGLGCVFVDLTLLASTILTSDCNAKIHQTLAQQV